MKPTAETFSELQKAYDHFNHTLFESKLPGCLLSLQRIKRTMGYFSSKRFTNANGRMLDEIAVNPEYFAVVPLLEVMQTLVHEMAHQWQHHHGTPGRARYHNKQWGDMLESIGLMPSHNGKPGGKRTGDHMADYPIAGGKFLEACKTLLTKQFKIVWFDRYPPRRSATVEAEALDTDEPVAELDEIEFTIPANAGTLALAEEGANSNKSHRNKYKCLNCDINLWGKPKLKVICGTCNTAFKELQK